VRQQVKKWAAFGLPAEVVDLPSLDAFLLKHQAHCKLPQDQVRGIVETHNQPELWSNEEEQMDGSADRSDAARA
jgi:hypothetical protein